MVKEKVTVYLDETLSKEINKEMAVGDFRSKSEFVKRAIRYYCLYLNKDENARLLSQEFENMLKSTVNLSEKRMKAIMYKIALEVGMINYLIATKMDGMDDQYYDKVRGFVVKKINESNGNFELKNINEDIKNMLNEK